MAKPYGINSEGLRRRGFSAEAIAGLKLAYKTLYRRGLLLEDAKRELQAQAVQCPPVGLFVEFLNHSKRGFIR
jgi:UDP-N-acetylglucosamine acyltransferase